MAAQLVSAEPTTMGPDQEGGQVSGNEKPGPWGTGREEDALESRAGIEKSEQGRQGNSEVRPTTAQRH